MVLPVTTISSGVSSQRVTSSRNRVPWTQRLLCFLFLVGCLVSVLDHWLSTGDYETYFPELDSSTALASSEDALLEAPKEVPDNEDLFRRLPPSVWSSSGVAANPNSPLSKLVASKLTQQETAKAQELCGKFLFSTLRSAVQVRPDGKAFVATGDIDFMWTRDSAVQIGLYAGRPHPFLNLIVQGAIRQQAFYILQDPYGNAYYRHWQNPLDLPMKDRVIGRGGWVATRNYELDSGAYFMTQLYDYYAMNPHSATRLFNYDVLILDAVLLLVDTWIVEQHHDQDSPYRYFELDRKGAGAKSGYTGMTWSGFRPSDDACKYGYLIPANVHAAAGLERILALNQRIWKSAELHTKANKLLNDIETGIRQHGIVQVPKAGGGTEPIYAYEVDGLGHSLADFDDANVPSLLSIPLLGWTGYDKQIYRNTRRRLLSKQNKHYYEGRVLKGIGSPHTPARYVWSMALAIQALTEEGTLEQRAESFAFQMRQSLASACHDAMHESVHTERGCEGGYTREWFEWANALFVVLTETALGVTCDATAHQNALLAVQAGQGSRTDSNGPFYVNRFQNNPNEEPLYFQGIEALVKHIQ